MPLVEILSELTGVGVASKRVTREYFSLLERFGNELSILRSCPLNTIKQAGYHLLSEALGNMREGRVSVSQGYDGEYGMVRVSDPVLKKTHKKRKEQPKQMKLFA